MTITQGDKLPEATFTQMGADGPEQVKLSDKLERVAIFRIQDSHIGFGVIPCW